MIPTYWSIQNGIQPGLQPGTGFSCQLVLDRLVVLRVSWALGALEKVLPAKMHRENPPIVGGVLVCGQRLPAFDSSR